ncbi:MAG TPA: M1 family aminopeptidase [Thermoanaerobaculia bacterium]|nr:M1 family aminopeptidase [Thermoanaerobaculia bacterium]
MLTALVALFLTLSLHAREVPEYQEMRVARPDGRSVTVQDLTLRRDAYRLHFRSGAFHFLAPLGGHTWGAVFAGDGMWELRPSLERERRHLALVTNRSGVDVLSDTFDSVILLFSDRTAEEIAEAEAVVTGTPNARAVQLYEQHLNEQKRKYQINLHLRVLQELLNAPAARGDVFLAVIDGKDFAPKLLVSDDHGIGALAARFADLSGDETALLSFDDQNGGFWYLAPAAGRPSGAKSSAPRKALDAIHYTIDTTIESNSAIKGTTTIRLQALTPGVRVVPIHVLPKVRLQRATIAGDGGEPVELGLVQEEVELGRLARLFRDEVGDADAAVVLPAPLEVNEPAEITIEYEGRDVLQSWGPDSYSVRARESWYPNLGTFVDTATYELVYRYPRRNQLISTGVLERETEEEGKRVAVWKSSVPMRTAGFNYGRFHKLSRPDEQSGMHVDVYTGRDRRKFASDVMADAVNAARIAGAYFGESPYKTMSVTQQVEWNFGQSWPSLIYLPVLALTSSTERVLALEGAEPTAVAGINEFAKMVGWHEVAHQWWGHTVGWQSYRDVWISEGFAEFTSALVLQFTEGPKKHDDYWERRRREILQKPRGGGVVHNDAGPVSQSFRLQTRYSPGAAQTIIYSKGAYVVHMLRSLMREGSAKNPDHRFIAMMKDFLSSYSWKSPSTDDFRRVVEKHMTPQMDVTGEGTMGWFFDQWIDGTDIPRLKSTLAATPAGDGQYAVRGSVSQEAVSGSFVSIVPIYADFGRDMVISMGSVRLVGNTTMEIDVAVPMPRAPRRILLNAFHDVLARD